MLEELLQKSILLTDEEKRLYLVKAQQWTQRYRDNLFEVLSHEKELVGLLFEKYHERYGKAAIANVVGSYTSFQIATIRKQEAEDTSDD